MGPRNHVLDGIQIGATWRIRLNHLCSAAMRAVATITVAACCYCRNHMDTVMYNDATLMILSGSKLQWRKNRCHRDHMSVASAAWRIDTGSGSCTNEACLVITHCHGQSQPAVILHACFRQI